MMKGIQFFKNIALLSLILLLFACNKEVITSPGMQEEALIESDDTTFVPVSQATGIAETFFDTLSNDSATKSNFRVASTEIIWDSRNENKPCMYVINYADEGFVIVSATKDYYPILAYSNESNFVLSDNMGGVAVWLEETKEAIRQSETMDEKIKAEIHGLWQQYERANNMASSNLNTKSSTPKKDLVRENRIAELNSIGYTCYSLASAYADGLISNNLYQECLLIGYEWDTEEYTLVVLGTDFSFSQVGPLVFTQWEQQNSYNALCSNYPDPAGCGAIAIAQIMKAHQFPSTYNWAGMANTYATNATQILIRDINNRIGSGSTVTEERSAFQYFGYDATVYDHNTQSVTLEIFNYHRPLLMGGYTNSFLGIPLGSGHSWVCDGARTESYSDFYYVEFLMGSPGNYSYEYDKNICTPQNPFSYGGGSITYFHMNWGWNSLSTPDGWFVSNNVNTHMGNYQHVRKNIYVSK